MSKVYTIAVTGGIGSGKTTISKLFHELGVPAIDSDVIGRDVMQPGQPAFEKIIQQFGRDILNNDDVIDRTKLAEIVFNDAEQKVLLERLLHPIIFREINKRINAVNFPYCLVVIPLLIETGSENQFDRVLVIDVPEEIQKERVLKRDGYKTDTINRILESQSNRIERNIIADDLIDNTLELTELQQTIKKLHDEYLKLADCDSTKS